MFNILFIFSIIPLVFSAVELKGKCPDAKSINNFDLTTFTDGLWYQVARYQNDWEKKGDCATLEFKKDGSSIKFNITELTDGVPSSYIGNVNIAADGTIDWQSSSFKEAEGSDDILTTFLDSDNKNYVIIYECRFDKTKSVSYVSTWVVSRAKKLEGAAKTAVDGFLKSSKLVDSSKLVWNHFDDKICS